MIGDPAKAEICDLPSPEFYNDEAEDEEAYENV